LQEAAQAASSRRATAKVLTGETRRLAMNK
jgi:hypothetical protein